MYRMILFITVVLLMNSPLGAIDLPPIKEGLWRVESSQGETMEQCVNSNSIREILSGANSPVKKMCDPMKIVKKGGEYVMNLSCKIMGMSTMFLESVISGDFSKRYTSTTKTTFTPKVMGMSDQNSRETAEYKGPCPKDMAPGTVRTASGKVMNPMKMAENMPDLSQIGKMMESGNMPSQAEMQKMIEAMKQAQQAR